MDRNESERDTERAVNGLLPHHHEEHQFEPSAPEKQNGLHEQVERLRLEVERLLDEQKALQRTPQSNDLHDGDQVEEHKGDDSKTRNPADRHGVLPRRPAKLVLVLVVSAILSATALRFWNY